MELLQQNIDNIKKTIKDWPKEKLINILKLEKEKKPYRGTARKTLITFIIHKLNPDKKKNNGKKEDKQIDYIIECINIKNNVGLLLIDEFYKNFKRKIITARKAGGRRNHHDFEIMLNDDKRWYKIEHKGCNKLSTINDDDEPWLDSCQFYNGDPKPFTLCSEYTRQWWNKYIKSGYLSNKYNIIATIPKYKEWVKDAYRQGVPITPYVIELKQKVEKKTGTKSLFVERKEFNNEFNVSDANIKTLIKQIQPIYEKIMKDKDYWLKINGDIRTNFNCKWYIKPDIIPKIVSMTRIENKLDPMFECTCDNGKKFIAHLRWGYNQGMTNLRLDLK